MSELITVCIPCYNGEDYVCEAVQSALDQTWPTLEVIVIDDGSTDGSLAALHDFGDRIRVIQQDNAGACLARNVGLEAANGSMIQFLDADDRLDPRKLALQAAAMKADEVDFVLCQGMIFGDGKGLRLKGQSLPDPTDKDAFVYCMQRGLSTPGPLYRADLLHQIGGFTASLPRAQELDLNLRFTASGGRLGWVNEALVHIRDHGGERITQKAPLPGALVKQYMTLSDQLETESMYAFTPTRRRAFATALFNHATHAYRAGAEDVARKAMDRCFDLDPHFDIKTRAWYARAARYIHPIYLEHFLKLGRCVKRWGRGAGS